MGEDREESRIPHLNRAAGREKESDDPKRAEEEEEEEEVTVALLGGGCGAGGGFFFRTDSKRVTRAWPIAPPSSRRVVWSLTPAAGG